MKVTTELKNLIKRSFDEKRAKVTNELKEMSKKLYEDKKKEVENTKEFKAYVKACKELYERFEEDYNRQGNYYDGNTSYRLNLNNMKNVIVEDIVKDNSDYYAKYNKTFNTNIDKEIKELNLAQESLLIKLTYEKDFDAIKEMLAEYDIAI